MEEKTEGLLLQAIPYLGHQKILKVFTPETGLLSFIVKQKKLSQLSPFLVAEWVYRNGKEDIHLLKDLTLLNDLLDLRESYKILSLAGQMAKDLLRSQFPAKQGKDLYQLTLAYLEKLPTFSQPETLAASFRLKLLLHEGLFSESAEKPFSSAEWKIVRTCATTRRFSLLETVHVSSSLSEKIEIFFLESLR